MQIFKWSSFILLLLHVLCHYSFTSFLFLYVLPAFSLYLSFIAQHCSETKQQTEKERAQLSVFRLFVVVLFLGWWFVFIFINSFSPLSAVSLFSFSHKLHSPSYTFHHDDPNQLAMLCVFSCSLVKGSSQYYTQTHTQERFRGEEKKQIVIRRGEYAQCK